MLEFFDDAADEQELNEQLRAYREAFRSGQWTNGQPSVEALENMVHYCLDTQRFDDAENLARLWREKAPYSSDAWHKLGIALGSLNRCREALDVY